MWTCCPCIHQCIHQNKKWIKRLQILNSTPLSSPTSTTMQLVPPSAAISPGGLCLPQLAVEWNNHAVTPQEQKGPNPSVTNPSFQTEASLWRSGLRQRMHFHEVEDLNLALSHLISFSFLAHKDQNCYMKLPMLVKSKERISFWFMYLKKTTLTCLQGLLVLMHRTFFSMWHCRHQRSNGDRDEKTDLSERGAIITDENCTF